MILKKSIIIVIIILFCLFDLHSSSSCAMRVFVLQFSDPKVEGFKIKMNENSNGKNNLQL